MKKKKLVLVVVSLIYLLMCACIGPNIKCKHTLHPGNNESIEIQIDAYDNDGVKSIDLYIYEYELYTATSGMHSARRRSGGTWGHVQSWTISPSQNNVTRTHTLSGFPAHTYVNYKVVAKDDENDQSDCEIGFQAGDNPWPDYPIVLYIKDEGAPVYNIDLCFIPDEDYNQNWSDFVDDLDDLIYNGYFTNDMVDDNRQYWSFYYVQLEGDANENPRRLNLPTQASLWTHMDANGIMHQTFFRDAASGNTFSCETVNDGTALHETSHAVFNLVDEYCCDSYYHEMGYESNLYDTQTECESHNSRHGWPITDCGSFTANGTTWYHPEPHSLDCIMYDDGDATMPQYARTCEYLVRDYYINLVNP